VPDHPSCERFHHAVELIGARWSGVILWAMLGGSIRFGEIKAAAGVSDTMLTRRLREFQREGLVERKVLPTTPVTVEYHLTGMGRELEDVIASIAAWAHKWMPLPAGETGAPEPVRPS
jgi:DNA-binding HxlR family transcriptional regulator